jgi:hypothetical protein
VNSSLEMQFYLSKMVDEDDLINCLSDILGLKIETLDKPNDQAQAFVMITVYDNGFPMDITVSWKQDVMPQNNYLSIAKKLANYYKILVATDLPESHPDQSDPYYWCVAEPGGNLVEMVEDISKERDGLVLDNNFKKIIE